MLKVLLLRGLPGSGKTTWAKELQEKEPNRWKRINKDELRATIDGGRWSRGNEDMILHIRDTIILEALNRGKNVIVDDTNFSPHHETRIRQLVGKMATVEIKDFTDIPLEECVKRDLQRLNSVGESVIRKMYNQYLKPKPIIVKYNFDLPSAILVDIDGTLALLGNRNAYERDFINDEVNIPVLEIVKDFSAKYKIILVSGRKSKFLDETKKWLNKCLISYNEIYMPRADDDNRKDIIIKREIYETYIKLKYNVLFVLDDRSSVVEFWRSLGLTCFQVAEGDF